MTTESCEVCRFFTPNEQANGEAVGDCRRHPPTVFMVAIPSGGAITRAGQPQLMNMQMKFPAAWPFVQGGHWCGEFQLHWKLSKAKLIDRPKMLDPASQSDDKLNLRSDEPVQ